MAKIVGEVHFSIPYNGFGNDEAFTNLLESFEEAIIALGGTVDSVRQPIHSEELIKLGIPTRDMLRLTQVGILSVEDLLNYSEDKLRSFAGINYGFTFIVRRLLHSRSLYLKGDSEARYRSEIIAYLSDEHSVIYKDLRERGITMLPHLAHHLRKTRPLNEARNANVVIANRLGVDWSHKFR